MINLETPRLVIRQWKKTDADAVFAMRDSPQLMKYYDYAIGDTLRKCRSNIKKWNKHGEMLAIALRENDIPIGIIGLTDVNRGRHYKEVEYALADTYHRRGIVSEALNRLLEYAFSDDTEIRVVAASIPVENIPSRKTVEKCGFTYEGTLRGYYRDGGDIARYSILKEEMHAPRELP